MLWSLSMVPGGGPTTALATAFTAAATTSGSGVFGGTDLLRLLVLAFGGALVVGNVLALIRPPSRLPAGDPHAPPLRPPLARSVVMISIGMVAVIWAVATLTS